MNEEVLADGSSGWIIIIIIIILQLPDYLLIISPIKT